MESAVISLAEFRDAYKGYAESDKDRMLWKLCCVLERIAMVGLDKHRRAEVAQQVLSIMERGRDGNNVDRS